MKKEIQTTTDFHQDKRATLVLIQGKLFELVPSELRYNEVLNMGLSERPHVRFLGPIPVRTKEEQEIYNAKQDQFEKLNPEQRRGQDATSLKRAIELGVDPEEEVKKLLKLKESTQDPGELSRIRRKLRKLGYKRYQEGDQDD